MTDKKKKKINLEDYIVYTGQTLCARRILMNHIPVETVAIMTDQQVLSKIQDFYTPVACVQNGERIILIKNEDVEAFENMSVYLDR